MLFYNCILPFGDKLKKLVEDYDLLSNLSDQGLSQERDLDFYPKTKGTMEEIRQFVGSVLTHH